MPSGKLTMEISKLDGALEILVNYAGEPNVTLRGEVDFRSMDRIKQAICSLLERGEKQINVDVGELVFMDSTGLSALLDAAKAILPNGADVTLVSPSAQLVKVLDRSGFSNVFKYEKVNEMHGIKCPEKKETGNVIEFEVPSRPEMISHIRARVADFACSMPFTNDEIEDIKLAVGEAGTNALRHGSNPDCCKVYVRTERHHNALRIFISDKGCGFDPEAISPPEFGDLALNGRGIMFMRALMDEVKFHFGSPGTCVELTKYYDPLK